MPGYFQWPPKSVLVLRSDLDDLQDLTIASTELDTTRSLARLLVVRSSGFIEQAVHEVLRQYVEQKSGGPTRAFARSWIENTRNPTPENLGDLVGRFDRSWRDQFDSLLDADDQRLRRELYYLNDRRNKVAHGLNENINRTKSLALKEVAIDITDWFVIHFDPR